SNLNLLSPKYAVMKTKISLLFGLLLFVQAVFAQANTEAINADPSKRTLEDMGYRNESITGIAGALTYFVKVQPRDDLNNMKLVLNIKPSPVLNSKISAVTVALKDEPVHTERLAATAIDSVMVITIPLNSRFVQPDGRFIKVRIDAKMAMSDEFCKDVDNPAIWMSVRNSSYLAIAKQEKVTYYQSLKETILEYDRISTPVNADLNDLLASGVLYALMKQRASLVKVKTDNYKETDTVGNTVVTGLYNKIPAILRAQLPEFQAGQGCIANLIPYGDNRHVLVITGKDEVGYKKAINVLTNYKIINSSFSYRMIIDNGAPNYFDKNALPVVFSLEELGGTPRIMEGVGALKTNYAFSLSDYNAIPKKLTFHLEAMLSLLKSGDRGFLNVYLNDNLVFSTDLHDRTNFVGDIDLKPYLLTKNNSLIVEMRFHPQGSICKEGFANFFGFIDTKTSNLVFSGEKVNEFYNFFNYPGEFRKKALKFVVTPYLLPSLSSSMGELIHQLNTTTIPANYLYIPEMVTSDKATPDDLRDFNAIALVQRNDPFIKNFTNSLPVQFNRDFQLYKDVSGQTAYSINDFASSGIAQIFKQGPTTYLLVTALGDTAVGDAFESVISSFGSQYSAIESNVCIANNRGKSNFFFKLPDNAGVVTYRGDKNNLLLFWNNYKLFIMIGAVLLLVALFFFVRRRVKRSQEIV
ncbi:MAG: cellulose biosynthesis cyclic di-GMP-binding regulatory protein BcsB, partial [Chitinophagaceae bacterium]|nr:cellulose biosynthesis cyclic di-GMP-binding regulatory protein BcsB [Chitinophagaceae bacterium]